MHGGPIYSERRGHGTPTLLFIHGWCADASDWRNQRARFETSNLVVTCDLRGHGASADIVDGCDIPTAGADVAGLIAQDGVAPAVLVGHGLGCRVALAAAALAPEALVGVVFIDGDRHAVGDPEAAIAACRKRYPEGKFGAFRDALLESMFLGNGASPDRERIVERARRVPEIVAERYWESILRWDAGSMEGALRDLKVPLLVLQSTYLDAEYRHLPADPRMTTPWLEVIGRLVPTVRIQIIGGVGHHPMLDDPDAVNRCISTFLADATFRRFFEST